MGSPEEMSFLPGRSWSRVRRVATGKGALQGCQDVGRCPVLGAWLLCQRTQAGHAPSHGHNVPLSLPTDRGWEPAARRCSLREWLWCDTLSPPWPLLVHKPELWQGRTCGPGCPLSSLLQGPSPRTASWGCGPPRGGFAGPGLRSSRGEQWHIPAPAPLPGTTMAGAGVGAA